MRRFKVRAESGAWAREQARRIARWAYDDEPLGAFNAAQRVEAVLCRWQWLDDDFPPSVADFVFGWSISGPETDHAIKEAAHELMDDSSGNGAALPPRGELD